MCGYDGGPGWCVLDTRVGGVAGQGGMEVVLAGGCESLLCGGLVLGSGQGGLRPATGLAVAGCGATVLVPWLAGQVPWQRRPRTARTGPPPAALHPPPSQATGAGAATPATHLLLLLTALLPPANLRRHYNLFVSLELRICWAGRLSGAGGPLWARGRQWRAGLWSFSGVAVELCSAVRLISWQLQPARRRRRRDFSPVQRSTELW